jgi:hypothetical protein
VSTATPFSRLDELQVRRVEFVPERPLEHGVLYLSDRFRTSIHLCACGCGEEVVLPFNSEQFPELHWTKSEMPEGRVTMRPSVGN